MGGGDDLLVAVASSGPQGLYRFADLAAGQYYLAFNRPRGRGFSPQDVGDDDTLDSDVDPQTGRFSLFSLATDEVNETLDAGLIAGFVPDTMFDHVAEAAAYELIYSLDIQDTAAYNAQGVPYTVDNSQLLTGTFDRVAYYLEVVPDGGGPAEWVYVSMDAFTTNPGQIGVPNTAGSFQQRTVSNMNVASNVPGVVTGEGIRTLTR